VRAADEAFTIGAAVDLGEHRRLGETGCVQPGWWWRSIERFPFSRRLYVMLRSRLSVYVIRAVCVSVGLAILSVATARGEPVAAYMYSQNGVDGIPTLASIKPADVGTVFLKAADIAENGVILPKLDGNGRFYPNAWTGTPRPAFAAMINAPPTFDWAGRDPAADLTAALTANNWQQDYDAGITVDAEFSGAVDSFPANWQSTMTSLRTLANGQGQGFSLYVNPKYPGLLNTDFLREVLDLTSEAPSG